MDVAYLTEQLNGLEAQKGHLVAQLHRAEGGLAALRHLIGVAGRAEDELKAPACPEPRKRSRPRKEVAEALGNGHAEAPPPAPPE